MPIDTDLLLLDAARGKDKEAMVKIFDLYSSPLFNYALRLCGDGLLADHIVGDVFVKLLEQFASGNGPTSNLRSYLYEMTYHRIVDEARLSHRRAPLEALTSLKVDAHSRMLVSEDRLLLEKVLQSIQHDLTDDQRHVIVLRFLEDFNLRETAAILGKDINHVKVIQSRALTKLRKVFADEDAATAVSLPELDELSNAVSR